MRTSLYVKFTGLFLVAMLLIGLTEVSWSDIPNPIREAKHYQVTFSNTAVALASTPCQQATISTVQTNGTASVPVSVIRGSDAYGFVLPANAAKTFRGITTASALSVVRTDGATNIITITYETEFGDNK